MNKISRLYIVVSALLIVGLTVKIVRDNNFAKKSQKSQSMPEEMQKQIELLFKLNSVDSLLLSGNFEKAKTILDELSYDDKKSQNIISIKYSLIDEFDFPNVDSKMDTAAFSEDMKLIVRNMQSKNDSIIRFNRRTKDSLYGQISELREQLIQAKRQQGGNDNIQVITFKGLKGTKIHYLGEVSSGKANGNGIGIWTTGSIYRGEWKNNIRHGQGVYEWADGEKYEGVYIDGKRHGFGKYYWSNGERYEGQWVDDRRNGKGILFDPDSNIKYEGEWKEDKPHKK